MKLLFLPVMLLLSACSVCNIPLVKYGSQGGTEHLTTLDLRSDKYSLLFEQWKPGGYEDRSKKEEQGRWSCAGNSAEVITKKGVSKAEYKEIGKNPLQLLEATKALVFMPSEDKTLSKEVFYPLEILK